MNLLLTRLGDSVTPLLLWVVTIIAALLLLTWYVKTVAVQGNTDSVDEDLRALHYDLSLACTNDGLYDQLSLHTTAGNLSINATDACIRVITGAAQVNRCMPHPCVLPFTTSFDLSQTHSIIINKTRDAFTIT